MPRDNDKHNAPPRGRRDGPSGGKGRSGAARGPDKKFAKRGFAGKSDGDKRPYAGKPDGARSFGKKPYAGGGKSYAGKRDGDAPRRDYGDKPRRDYGDKPRRDYGDAPRREHGDAPRPTRFNRDDRAPRRDSGDRPDRGAEKPWQKRDAAARDARPPRDGARKFDRPRSDKPRFDRPRDDRGGDERPRVSRTREDRPDRAPRSFDKPKFDKPKFDRPKFDRPKFDKPKFDRPREDRTDRPKFGRPREARADSWQEHPRSEGRDRFADRARRDNEDDSKIFAKRPAFGGRGAYRERALDPDKRMSRPEPRPKKAGERIAKLMARAGLASRRDAEEWVTQGRVTVNGRVINSPALDITENDVVMVDGKPLPERERTRLFLYHKPRGLMTTHADPEGRPTVFDHLPDGLPRLISVGRLDFNTEGLLLLTNDGGLARVLELPDTGWLRRYRVRAHGEVTQAQLDTLRDGVEVDGIKYGPIEATLDRDQSANVWIVIAIREGKNREVRNILGHLGLEVNRLIRISYGPFQLGEIAEGEVDEVKTRVLREQLGDKIAALAGAEFARTVELDAGPKLGRDGTPLRPKKSKPRAKRSKIEDRKGRSVVVQRTGSDEARARNEAEASGYGPPRRPKRGYHGKRDLTPRD